VIFPVPVTLNRFLALEFVFTFGIYNALIFTPVGRFSPENTYGAFWAIRITDWPVLKQGRKGMVKMGNNRAPKGLIAKMDWVRASPA
jgi:hypothetical protein